MTVFQKFLLVSIAALVLLAACNSELDELPTPTPVDAALQRLNQPVAENESVEEADTEKAEEPVAETGDSDIAAVFSQSGCIACHAVSEDAPPGVGPAMPGVIERAEEAIASPDYSGEAKTVEEYLRESILNPAVYIEPDYQPVMPTTYEDTLTDEQVDQLVEYLQTFH
ncbi:MAG: c-type cytochrome [Anaerolineae bacterium]|nr:c-type cytochrome [Anaerolineae bacterium]